MSAATFLDDIRAQPETLSRLCGEYGRGDLRQTLRHAASAIRSARMPVCLTGMGASYFALVAAKARLDKGGIRTSLEDTAYLIEYGSAALPAGQPVVLVTQSGRTGEAIGLLETLGDRNPLIVVTNEPATPVADAAQFLLPLMAQPDGGVALKTYTGSVALLLMLAAEVCKDSVDIATTLLAGDPMKRAISTAEGSLGAMLEFAEGNGYTTLLGRGPSIASALGGALLLKETAKLPAEGANAGQFRHGAIEVISEGSFVVMFSPRGESSQLNLRLAAQLEQSGAHVLFIGPADRAHARKRFVVEIETPDEYLAPVFEIIPLQFLSHAIALHRGIEPGTFLNTTPVVLTR